MSSHHEWVEEVVRDRDLNKPFAPENGQPLCFKVGDSVIYTNDNGVEFSLTVSGFYKPTGPCSLYATGYRYFLEKSPRWMPVRQASLKPGSKPPASALTEFLPCNR